MITPRLRKAAAKRGIFNAYQLQKVLDIPIGHAYRLWDDDWKQIKLTTLDRLCHALRCRPNDLLEFTTDPEEK